MSLIREVQPGDLDSLAQLAAKASFGLTTLPADRQRLSERIDASRAGEAPLLVMVDKAGQDVIGTAGLFTQVGDASKAEPFYAYRLERSVHRSDALDVHNEVDALHLVKLFDGPTELGTLFLDPSHRGGGIGRVLSLSRFLFIASQPESFDQQVIAELRGVIDADGCSPFWDALGRHFFQVDFPVADALSARDKRFIAELMPTHPIYVPLLPKSAQDVIGQVHPQTVPARKLLESEGFYFAKMVDIFDGGPCVRCDQAAIRTIRESTTCNLIETYDPPPHSRVDTLVATVHGEFRVLGCASKRSRQGIAIPKPSKELLQLNVGDPVLVSPLVGDSLTFWSGGRPSMESSK
ncbi:MAG: arginine N-succinyltransferase [Planctomycetota bacterium]